MKAYVFPGQGAQFTGMGKDLYDSSSVARDLFKMANDILGFNITNTMFTGSVEELKQTKVTQPAIFLHSTILAKTLGEQFRPDCVAGHSLGEFSALVAAGILSFEEGLKLVAQRAMAMQEACDKEPSTMAAILGMEDDKVEAICNAIDEIVVPANYNCPGQLVISGSQKGIEMAIEKAKEAGAKRALPLPVGGAFHSPLMEPAREKLAAAIEKASFTEGICPIYQNVSAKSETNVATIKENLIAQLTSPVRWTQIMYAMINDGCEEIVEVGPGKVLQGLFKKVDRGFPTSSAEIN